MSLVHNVHSCEAIVNRLVSFQNRAAESVRDSRIGLGGGLVLAAVAGAPMPLPQISLAGPFLATLAAGKFGGRAAAAVGFVSYLAFNRPEAAPALMAGVLAVFVGWAAPFLLERLGAVAPASSASAVVVNCDGFASLDSTYGSGTGSYAFNLLRKAIELETRDSDLVVHAQGHELILVLEGSNPGVAQAVMARVEQRFSGWLADAGYECNLSVGLASSEIDPIDPAHRSVRGPYSGPYLD